MTCRGCGPSPDPEQDREHNDWCPDNPRRDLATTEQGIRGLRAEVAALRLAEAEAMALVMNHEGHIERLRAENAYLRSILDEFVGILLRRRESHEQPSSGARFAP